MGNLGCIDWVKTQQLQVYHYPFLTVKGKGFCVYKCTRTNSGKQLYITLYKALTLVSSLKL